MNKEFIKNRKDKLELAKLKLKQEFFGIDDVIDNIINSITAWYCLPDMSKRPTIVNLYGLTGTGKTDLVRKLSYYLEILDNYAELQFGSDGIIGDYTDIKKALDSFDLDLNNPNILLLDEIQRFRSIDQDNKLKDKNNSQDLWQLLSDGVLDYTIEYKKEIASELCYYKFASEDYEDDELVKTKMSSSMKRYLRSDYSDGKLFRKMNKMFPTDINVDTLKDYTPLLEYYNNIQNSLSYTPIIKKYNKTLIFICGNLKESYDTIVTFNNILSIDELKELSCNIPISSIKKELLSIFTPEQVARFGNNYIIYPTIDSSGFTSIISKHLDNIKITLFNDFNINIKFSDNVYNFFLDNWVSPIEGVRPLLSTLGFIIDSNINNILLEDGSDNIYIDIIKDKDLYYLVSGDYKKNIETKYSHCIKTDNEELIIQAVHEAGHTIAHCKILNYTPVYAKINLYQNNEDAYILSQADNLNLISIDRRCMISYAGRVAEELFFGSNLVTNGCVSDIKKVTELLHKKYRVYGYSIKHLTTVDTKNISSDDKFLEREELSISEEANNLYNKTKEIIIEYKELVEILAKELLIKNTLSAKEIKTIVEPYFKDIKLGKVNTTIYDEGYVL